MTRKPLILRGLLAGVAAGLAGSLTMTLYQEIVARNQRSYVPPAENTTEKTGRQLAEAAGRPLTQGEEQRVGRGLHYGFGIVMGAGYGVAAEYLPMVGVAAGVPFGLALWMGTDLSSLPLLDLAQRPSETKPIDHVLHLGSHLVYTTTLELTRRQLQRLL